MSDGVAHRGPKRRYGGNMPAINRITGTISALERWTPMPADARSAATEPGRAAFAALFGAAVDAQWPGLEPRERNRRVRSLPGLYFARLRLAAIQRQREVARRGVALTREPGPVICRPRK